MKETFNIEDMAMITGLSTRTIRSYIAGGFLEGDKSSGSWQFTPEQADAFLQNKTVQPTLRSKKNAIVFDFLGASHKDADAMCVVLDLPSDQAVQVSRLFCGFMGEIRAKAELRFASDRIGKTTRLILSGSDSDVMELRGITGSDDPCNLFLPPERRSLFQQAASQTVDKPMLLTDETEQRGARGARPPRIQSSIAKKSLKTTGFQ